MPCAPPGKLSRGVRKKMVDAMGNRSSPNLSCSATDGLNNLLQAHSALAGHILEDLPESANRHRLMGRNGEVAGDFHKASNSWRT